MATFALYIHGKTCHHGRMASEQTWQRIEYIRKLLASGAQSTTVDGVSTSFSHVTLRTELRRLEEEAGLRTQRPRVSTMNLRNV